MIHEIDSLRARHPHLPAARQWAEHRTSRSERLSRRIRRAATISLSSTGSGGSRGRERRATRVFPGRGAGMMVDEVRTAVWRTTFFPAQGKGHIDVSAVALMLLLKGMRLRLVRWRLRATLLRGSTGWRWGGGDCRGWNRNARAVPCRRTCAMINVVSPSSSVRAAFPALRQRIVDFRHSLSRRGGLDGG